MGNLCSYLATECLANFLKNQEVNLARFLLIQRVAPIMTGWFPMIIGDNQYMDESNTQGEPMKKIGSVQRLPQWTLFAVIFAVLFAVASRPAWADGDLSLGVAVPGLSVFLGNNPGYYAAPVYAPPPVYYVPPPRRVYYVPAPPPPPPPPLAYPAPGYYVQPAPIRYYRPRPWQHHGPPPWAGRWRHDDGWRH